MAGAKATSRNLTCHPERREGPPYVRTGHVSEQHSEPKVPCANRAQFTYEGPSAPPTGRNDNFPAKVGVDLYYLTV